jgi:hypothetical protein
LPHSGERDGGAVQHLFSANQGRRLRSGPWGERISDSVHI